MKAARLDALGGPESILLGDLPDPSPQKGQVLLRVKACSLNHLDIWVRQGLPAYKIRLPHVLGNDIAGEVIGHGPGVDPGRFPVGSRVIVSPGVSCWSCRWCESGRDNLCERYAILGADGGWGGYAELAAVPASNLLPLPAEGMAWEEAASVPLAFLTAWHMLKTLAGAGPGKTVLVIGAGSGVGAAALQIAKALECRVIACSTSEPKLEAAKALGADETVHLPKESIFRRTKRITGGAGADIVFEHVGPPVFKEALRSLAPGGRLVTCGSTGGPSVELDLRHVFFRELSILGAKMGTLRELKDLCALFEEGKLKPVVDKVFPLAEAAEAHRYLEGRRQFGKVVLRA